jgi:hypothetical protein
MRLCDDHGAHWHPLSFGGVADAGLLVDGGPGPAGEARRALHPRNGPRRLPFEPLVGTSSGFAGRHACRRLDSRCGSAGCRPSEARALSRNKHRMKPAIAAIERTVRRSTRERVALFTGSSTTRIWPDLEADFPGGHCLNTGFDGSRIAASTDFAPVRLRVRTLTIISVKTHLCATFYKFYFRLLCLRPIYGTTASTLLPHRKLSRSADWQIN